MQLTERQKLYLFHAFILRSPEKVILTNTDLKKEEFKTWWVELEEERIRLKPIRDLWIRKKCEEIMGFEDFEKHLNSKKKFCHYCKITETEIEKLWKIEEAKGKELTKRGRGRKLELERIEPNVSYGKMDNLVFACYWCNNAKTDTFTGEEFKHVGEVFQKIWSERLQK